MSSVSLFKKIFYRNELGGRNSFRNRKKAIDSNCAALELHEGVIDTHYGKAE
jgi:hypothetical protein